MTITPAEVIKITGSKYAVVRGGFSYYEVRQFKEGKNVTPFIEQCFVDLLKRYHGIKPDPCPPISPSAVKPGLRDIKSGLSIERREDFIINLVYDHGQASAEDIALGLNLYRDQAYLDIKRLVRAGVLAVVPNGATFNKSYEIAKAGNI